MRHNAKSTPPPQWVYPRMITTCIACSKPIPNELLRCLCSACYEAREGVRRQRALELVSSVYDSWPQGGRKKRRG